MSQSGWVQDRWKIVVRDEHGEPVKDKRGKPKKKVITNNTAEKVRYRARYRKPGPKPRKEAYALFATREEAEAWVRDELSAMYNNEWTDPEKGKQKFGDFYETWFKWWEQNKNPKPKTVLGYRELLDYLILPTFRDMPLVKIDVEAVDNWLTELAGKPGREKGTKLSAQRRRQARTLLRQILDYAVRVKRIGRNPVADTDAPEDASRKRRNLYLTQGGLAKLAGAAEAIRQGSGTLVQVMGWGGLRWGEAVGLRTQDVDLDLGVLHVRQTLTEVSRDATGEVRNGLIGVSTPKSGKARVVPLPPDLIGEIAPLLQGKGGDDDLMFTTPSGGPLRASNWRTQVWNKAVASAGLSRKDAEPKGVDLTSLTPHDLRDTAAALMARAELPIEIVSEVLGHSSIEVTRKHYLELFPDDVRDKVQAALGSIYQAPVAAQNAAQGGRVVNFPRK